MNDQTEESSVVNEPIYYITPRQVSLSDEGFARGVNDLYFIDGRNLVWYGLFVSYHFSHWTDRDDLRSFYEVPVVRSFQHFVGDKDPFYGDYTLLGQVESESPSTMYVGRRNFSLETLPKGTSVTDYYFVYPDRALWLGFTLTEYESLAWNWDLTRFALEGTAGILPPCGEMTLKEFSKRHFKAMECIDMGY